MNKKYTLLLILSFVCLSYSFMLPPDLSYHVNRLHGSSLNMKFVEGILSAKGKILNKIKPFFPLIGFYTVMNLPIYGIGIGSTSSFGLGSMTDFSTLKNRGIPGVIANEYIVAPEDFTSARVDMYPSEYSIPASDLKAFIKKTIANQPRTTFIAEDESSNRIEFVQRTLIFRFPDVVTFQAIPLGEKESTLAVHSYSIYGAGDLGVNKNRVKTWIQDINAAVDAPTEIK